MKPRFQSFVCLLLAAVFLHQTALASVSESSFWQERRKNLAGAPKDQPAQLAALPLPSANNAALLRQLPSLAPSPLPSASLWTSRKETSIAGIPPALERVVKAVPLNTGIIREMHVGNSAKHAPIVLIQDVHLNPEAQGNIAAVLQ